MSPSWKIHPTASSLVGVKVVNRKTVWATGGFDAPENHVALAWCCGQSMAVIPGRT